MWSYPALSTAADALFDGGGMADQGIVFVNYNYRIGSFGWLATPELTEEFDNGHNTSGNWGMLDQFAALKWIKANIAEFGGDPGHITVMGQSAGSAATQHILNSPLTKGLIVGAIIESGVRDPQDPLCTSLAEAYTTIDSSYSTGTSYLKSLNVSTIAEARELPMENTYYNTLVNKLAQDMPVITGNTKDESGASYGLDITVSEYLTDLNETYSGFTDRSKVGTWFWSRPWNKAYSSPVYNYIWDHAPPGQDQGAYHESEINYVLNNLYATDMPWAAEDYAIANKMNGYWSNFIKTGNPNGHGLTAWSAANSSAPVQHVGDGWGQIPAASSRKVSLFKSWFSTLHKY
ncbi:unnamed protein product [Penicillium olsonii]|uniref:Carboxylic ester hydrolase n=1 Tax=Penicillium olsonii TaxID=99116 RepID=A0A9W4HYX4_PENOL|nr:unnamed protein product [Penicillium olsonii]CAG8170342.1 unnamed protein product [Penicillium olsonii]